MRELDGAQLLLLTGDYSYGTFSLTHTNALTHSHTHSLTLAADGYGPLWDIFGRLMEPLLSEMPMIGVFNGHLHLINR